MSLAAPSGAVDGEIRRSADPSMEDILASIRAIISEDREPQPKPEPRIVYSNAAPRAEPPPPPTVVWSRGVEPAGEPIVSEQTHHAVASSFKSLSDGIAAQGLETAEKLARDMLRPMLKAWLDQNLPSMVERLVKAEIERMARPGR